MKQYYIYRNNENHGPFNLEELKTQQISKGTMVWFEGLEDWVKAGQTEDLQSLFILAPPPVNSITSQVQSIDKNQSEIKEVEPLNKSSIKKSTIFLLVGLFIVASVLFYFYNLQSENQEKIIEKNQQTELYNKQQKVIEAQNAILAKQEQIELARIANEKKQVLNNKINEINSQLKVNYQDLENAKQKLNDVTRFKLLRSSSKRKEQINAAQNNIEFIEDKIRNLEDEMKKINPNWQRGK